MRIPGASAYSVIAPVPGDHYTCPRSSASRGFVEAVTSVAVSFTLEAKVDVEIGVPSAGAGAKAPLPGGQSQLTVQKVGETIQVVQDGSLKLVLDLQTAAKFADVIWDAVKS